VVLMKTITKKFKNGLLRVQETKNKDKLTLSLQRACWRRWHQVKTTLSTTTVSVATKIPTTIFVATASAVGRYVLPRNSEAAEVCSRGRQEMLSTTVTDPGISEKYRPHCHSLTDLTAETRKVDAPPCTVTKHQQLLSWVYVLLVLCTFSHSSILTFHSCISSCSATSMLKQYCW